ncbi:ATP-dependent Clp protease adapter ClpS [Bartonella sp. F02]|uniref:ATP-dependent Clp protease adapter ClpS n=1 Tax=Bartonella sp. F02 TaxID=2967262 RepID=UPI0022A8D685|nr:ATP-dependent Clp protease adapter ClpS [Bartonella sp. F02]MCZ2328374.1 ATP-dependent Clp protease adapter ClpS [Bartonella sp. F02]
MVMQKFIINLTFCVMHDKKSKNWNDDRDDTVIMPKLNLKLQKPKLYRVLLLNDDYTPMDFVIFVLKSFFKKNYEEATRIMLKVHQNGVGECGSYTYEVAEMKVIQVMECARQNEHPLQCVMEQK